MYGTYRWFKSGMTSPNEWLKKISCLSKEPMYTSFTNEKMCVDYIFYQGEGINVVRVLDLPSYTNNIRDNLTMLPHPLMPSDHISIVADFLLF